MEQWKDIKGFEGKYQVSNLGNVKSLKRYSRNGKTHNDKILTPRICKRDGYAAVTISHEGKYYRKVIHRLVAQAFIPNVENKPQVNHVDQDKTNNRLSNLEWVTPYENMHHADGYERRARTRQRKVEAYNNTEVIKFECVNDASKHFGLKIPQSIYNAISGHTKTSCGYKWRWVE